MGDTKPAVGEIELVDSNTKEKDIDNAEETRDLRYGCFRFKPTGLQCLNTIVGAVAFLSLANCFQSLANGLLGVMLSTLEKRFDLSSSSSSWIASAYEIGPIPIVIIISYFGTRLDRPNSCGWGLLSVAVGCVVMFIPQFTTPVYLPTRTGLQPEDSLCNINRTNPDLCLEDAVESLSFYLPVFIVSRLLIGMGSTPILTLGVTYMDDCATPGKFATYAGVFNAMSVIGPAVAFIGGGLMLSIYVDFYAVSSEDIVIDSADSRWIGAWWLPYTFAGGFALINAIPMFGYPPDLPGAAQIRREKVSEAHTTDQVETTVQSGEIVYARTFSEFKLLFKGVFTNPTWILLTIFTCADNFIIAGFTAFGPKLLEVLFSLSATLAGTLFGIVLLPAGAGGTIIGGLIVEKFKLSCSQIIRIEAVLAGFVTVATLLFLLTCDPISFAGVSVPYVDSGVTDGGSLNLTDICNVGCDCWNVPFEPVCSIANNIQYYSPCHAGCTIMNETLSEDKQYLSCSCIANVTGPAAVWGTCSGEVCASAIIFLVVFFFAVLFIFICLTMNMTATLRCVTSSESSFAISLQVLFIKLLGTIPGPIFMGLAFDLTCDLWQEECGVRGSCMSYVVSDLALKEFYLCFSVKLISLVATVLAVILYKPPKVSPEVSPEKVLIEPEFLPVIDKIPSIVGDEYAENNDAQDSCHL